MSEWLRGECVLGGRYVPSPELAAAGERRNNFWKFAEAQGTEVLR